MHSWGDEWFERYGDDLYAAERWIFEQLKKSTFCVLLSKEKWGSLRYEHVIPPKGHAYRLMGVIRAPWKKRVKISGKDQYGKPKTELLVYKPILWSWNESWLYRRWQNWAWKKLWQIVQQAVVKWPHLKRELESDIASHENLVGTKVHKQYWRSFK